MRRSSYGRWIAALFLALILRTILFTTPNNVQGGGFMMSIHLIFTLIIKIGIDTVLDRKKE